MRVILLSLALALAPAFAARAQVPDAIKNAPGRQAYPDADGLVLLEEVEIVLAKDGRVTRRHRRLTKVLREYMMRSGRCDPRVVFDAGSQTVEVLRCRTWMRDGTPVDADPKNSFVETTPFPLQHAVDYTRMREMVLVHAGVEHGATLELEYRIADRAPRGRPFWGEITLQSDLPVLKQVIVLRVPAGTPLVIQGVPGELKPEKKTENGVDTYTVARANVPAVNVAECAGHAREVLARLVYTTVPSWAEVGTRLAKAVARAIDSSDRLRKRVAALTAGAGTPLECVRRIHDFVAAKVRTIDWPLEDFGFTPRPASRVYAAAYGHGLDKAVLLKAMLKEAGISSAVVLASPAGAVAMRAPSPTQFAQVWVAAENGKERVWLDPTAPLGLRSGHELEGSAILKLNGRGSTVMRVPVSEPGTSAAVMIGVCRLAPGGTISGRVRLDLSGRLNPYPRLRGGVGPLEAYANRAAARLGGARARNRELSHFDERLTSLSITIEGGKAVRRDPDTVELTLPDLPDPLARRPVEIFRNHRTTPLFLPGAARETIDLEIRLPAGFRIAFLPAAVKLDNAVGRLEMTLAVTGRKVAYHKRFELKKSVISPAEYPAFRRLITAQRARRNTAILLERLEG